MTSWPRSGVSAAARWDTPAPSTPSRPVCWCYCSAARPRAGGGRGGGGGPPAPPPPSAPGLLVLLPARAPRLQRFLLELPKTYLATARLGWRSSPGDPDGELAETGRIPDRLELPTG